MTARNARVMLVLTAFTAGLVLFMGAALLVSGRTQVIGPPAPSAIGGPFRLVDQDGKTVTDETMKGKPFLVFFGFTHCPDVCPTALFEMSEVMTKLGPDGDRVGVLFVTETRSVWWLGVLFALAGVYVAVQEALEPAITADLVPDRAIRGTAMGVLGAVNGVGDFVASVGVGALFALGPQIGFGVAAGVMLAGMLMLAWRRPGSGEPGA